MKSIPTILEAIADEKLLGKAFRRKLLRGDTWKAWRAFLCAVFALPFEDDEAREIYRKCTGRTSDPVEPFREIYTIAGRRSGKSFVVAAIGTYIAAFRDHSPHLAPGEIPTVAIIAADKQQAAIILGYVRAFFSTSAILRSMIKSDLKEGIELKSGVQILIQTADFRSVRGRTLVCCLLDELAFFSTEGSANPDSELLAALRPGMVTIPDALLVGLSSPYAKRGELYTQYKTNFAKDDSPTLIWQADSRTMNPTLSKASIAIAYLRDRASAESEYGATFRQDLESFLTLELIEACTVRGRAELQRLDDQYYFAFCDPSGGRNDAMTLGIAHYDEKNKKAVLDLLAERVPPFSPEQTVADFVGVLQRYKLSEVQGDKYAGEWVAEQFSKRGISYRPSERSRSEIYLELLPGMTSGQVELLSHDRLIGQLASLERRVARSGKDSIDHAPGNHDDLANSAAGALVLALEQAGGEFGFLDWVKSVKAGIFAMPPEKKEETPRTRISKVVRLEFERQARGLSSDPIGKETWQDPKAPVCEKCQATCVVPLGTGFHCNQCSHDFYLSGREPTAIFVGHDGFIRRRVK